MHLFTGEKSDRYADLFMVFSTVIITMGNALTGVSLKEIPTKTDKKTEDNIDGLEKSI